ncbi:hypothethical protein (plasmid) [Ralstonia solanacearum CMR15]|nr:hypothethical protein [Ralstonia solanacearum CMR15]
MICVDFPGKCQRFLKTDGMGGHGYGWAAKYRHRIPLV